MFVLRVLQMCEGVMWIVMLGCILVEASEHDWSTTLTVAVVLTGFQLMIREAIQKRKLRLKYGIRKRAIKKVATQSE